MSMRLFLILTSVILYQCSPAKFLFKVHQDENKTYLSTTKISAESEVDFRGPKETLDKIKAGGTQLPLKINQDQLMIIRMRTFSKDVNGLIPFSGRLDSLSIVQYVNGELTSPQVAGALDTSFHMSGYYKNGETVIENIEGKGIQPEFKTAMKKSISKMMKSVKFPSEPLNIGDTFSQSVPLTIPLQGIMNINMVVTTHYKLINFKDNLGFFDLTQEFELASDSEKTKIKMNGTGSGNMVFDSEIFQIKLMHVTSKIKMNVNFGDMQIISDSNTKTEASVKVLEGI